MVIGIIVASRVGGSCMVIGIIVASRVFVGVRR
jgi:hypothetical protein